MFGKDVVGTARRTPIVVNKPPLYVSVSRSRSCRPRQSESDSLNNWLKLNALVQPQLSALHSDVKRLTVRLGCGYPVNGMWCQARYDGIRDSGLKESHEADTYLTIGATDRMTLPFRRPEEQC